MLRITQTPPRRDRWGRPIVEDIARHRASGAAKAVEDQSALIAWARRDAAVRVANSASLAAQVRAAQDDKRGLDRVVAQTTDAADWGTAIHTDLNKVLTDGTEPREQETAAALAALDAAGMVPVASEVFVVEGDYAGTLDLIVRKGDTYFVADLKTTGPKSYDVATYSGASWAAQCAVYARSHPFCEIRGHLSWPFEICEHTGFVILVERGSTDAAIYSLDLDLGWRIAALATEVRTLRSDFRYAAVLRD
jgi:hypothetical protein